MAAGEVWGEARSRWWIFWSNHPIFEMVSANCALLFLWNIFKCEGSRPLFVEKTKYKLISRCPPKLVSLPANTRLVSVARDWIWMHYLLFCLSVVSVDCGGLVEVGQFANTLFYSIPDSCWSEELIVARPTLFVKLREREVQRVDSGRSLKGHL